MIATMNQPTTALVHQSAKRMLEELDAGWLGVAKVRGRYGGYVRVTVSVNAEWYQRFCARYMASRRRYPKPRTVIKRCHTRAALVKLANGGGHGVYVDRLLRFMEDGNNSVSR